jgi:hypothetical protein
MFNKKKDVQRCEHETCRTCGAKIDKINPVFNRYIGFISYFNRTDYYCHTDKKPYSEIIININGERFFSKEVIVEEDGTPVGYKKIK